jgi:hypothetical protein
LAGLPEQIGKPYLLPTYLPTTLATSTLITLFSEMLKFPNKKFKISWNNKNFKNEKFGEGPKEYSFCRKMIFFKIKINYLTKNVLKLARC